MEDKTGGVIKRCGHCAGTGKAHGGDFGDIVIICPVCHGSAEVTVPSDSVLHIVCNGSGKIRLTKGPMGKINVTCPDCGGTGWFSPSKLTH